MTPTASPVRLSLTAAGLTLTAVLGVASAYAARELPVVNSMAQAVMFVALALVGAVSVLHYRSSEAIRRTADRQLVKVEHLLEINQAYYELAKNRDESAQRTMQRVPAEAGRAVERKVKEVLPQVLHDSRIDPATRSGEHRTSPAPTDSIHAGE